MKVVSTSGWSGLISEYQDLESCINRVRASAQAKLSAKEFMCAVLPPCCQDSPSSCICVVLRRHCPVVDTGVLSSVHLLHIQLFESDTELATFMGQQGNAQRIDLSTSFGGDAIVCHLNVQSIVYHECGWTLRTPTVFCRALTK